MRAELRIEYGDADVARLTVEDRPLVLGRAPDVDVQIADQRLSRHHCRLEVTGDKLVVTDLGSSNGTYFRNQRVQSAMLGAGDSFYIGRTKIVLESMVPTHSSAPALRPGGHAAARLAAARALEGTVAPPPPPAPAPYQPTPTIDVPPPIPRHAPATHRDSPAHADTGKLAICPVDAYQLVDRLGEGSMGTVYLARRLETGEQCVLKMMKLSANARDAIFFIRECQAGMKLKHPNVVELLDFGEAGGMLYLAMEYVDGGNLLERIKTRGPLSAAEAIRQMREITDALVFAFKKKIVHRDIKPANVLLTKSGQTKLADFGLAKTIKQAGMAGLTQAGEARGTPIYMAPEMLTAAGEADQRADIYSLGATYYHALAGAHPFKAPSVAEILRMVVQEEPPALESRVPGLDPAIAAMIRKMMRKNPAERYADPMQVLEELDRLAAKHVPATA